MADDFNVISPNDVAARPLRFFIDYSPNPDGGFREVEMVEYAAIGKAQNSKTITRIKDLRGTVIWDVFEKYYDAWKKGKEAPVDGTPLAVWAGVTPEQAEILRQNGIRSVEEVAAMPSSVASKIRFPGIDNLINHAKIYVGGADQRATELALKRKDEQISEMQSRMADMEATFSRMMEKQSRDDDEPASEPKRRGRPPKPPEASEHQYVNEGVE